MLCDLTFFHTTSLLRCQEFQKKLYKADKGRKGKIKGQGLENLNFDLFFMSLRSFSVDYAQMSLFSSFKVIKVKKATLIAGAAFLRMQLFLALKVVLQYSKELFKAPLTHKSGDK